MRAGDMSRPTNKAPMIVSIRAKQRLEAIYRQHKPDQPALVVGLHIGAAAANETPRELPFAIRAAVLDEPVSCTGKFAEADIRGHDSCLTHRDVHSEVYLTCNTLRSLQMLHGTTVEVSHIVLQHVVQGRIRTPDGTCLVTEVHKRHALHAGIRR